MACSVRVVGVVLKTREEEKLVTKPPDGEKSRCGGKAGSMQFEQTLPVDVSRGWVGVMRESMREGKSAG